MKIYLNKDGIAIYPWLASKWLDAFAYDFDKHCFLVWDDVLEKWCLIHHSLCRGDNMVK